MSDMWEADGKAIVLHYEQPIQVAGCCGNPLPNGECCGNAVPVEDSEEVIEQIGEMATPELAQEVCRLRALNAELVEALEQLTGVIEAAGINNLTRGVELGQTVWFVKANDAMSTAHYALSRARAETGGDSDG